MNIARFINRHYQIEDLYGEVELVVSQLVEDTISDDLEDRQEALMRLLFLLKEQEEENYTFLLMDKAIGYAFQHIPQHDRAIEDYLKELTGKGQKKTRRKKQTHAKAQGSGN
jgi:hypothetical protein